MAGNFNKVFLLGNLTRDIELKYTSTNQAVARIGLAVNRYWRTPEGEQREEVTFIDLEAWGKQAETMAKFLSKGRPVFIEGRLKLDQWEDKTTKEKRSKLKVVVEGFQFVDSRAGGAPAGEEASAGESNYEPRRAPAPARAAASGAPASAAPAPMGEEDIPF